MIKERRKRVKYTVLRWTFVLASKFKIWLNIYKLKNNIQIDCGVRKGFN